MTAGLVTFVDGYDEVGNRVSRVKDGVVQTAYVEPYTVFAPLPRFPTGPSLRLPSSQSRGRR